MYEPDEQLYNRFLHQGDESALHELMDRHGNNLTAYLDGYIHDIHDAEDLMIEAFARLVHAKPTLTPANTFRAYLYKTGRNLASRYHAGILRRAAFSLEGLEQEPESEELLEAVVNTQEQHRVLHVCMDKLEPELREALWLVYFEGMSYAEGARIMNVKPKRLDHLLQKGKQRLRAELEKEEITHAGY